MPAITSGKVLVTGANGYVAAWVVQDLLEHGFFVRGTVRSESKAVYLRDRFKAYDDKFEIVLVPDMSKVGCNGRILWSGLYLKLTVCHAGRGIR